MEMQLNAWYHMLLVSAVTISAALAACTTVAGASTRTIDLPIKTRMIIYEV